MIITCKPAQQQPDHQSHHHHHNKQAADSKRRRQRASNKLTTSSSPAQPSTSSSSSSTTTTTTSTCVRSRMAGSKIVFSNRKLLAGALICTVAALLTAPYHQPNGFQQVEGLKALKALAKTFVYQQLTMRKNFVPLPVPIPVPIEINEPPVYRKGKPKYVNVYKPKPTAAPVVAKPTTVYHMPIYSPTYEYMSMDPMSSMYGHVAPVVYPASPYGAANSKSAAAGHGSSSRSYYATDPADDSTSSADLYGAGNSGVGGGSYSLSGQSPNPSMTDFNDYDDNSGSYYTSRLGRRRAASKLLSATAGDYLSGASFDLRQRHDNHHHDHDTSRTSLHDDLVAAAASASPAGSSIAAAANLQLQQQQQLAANEQQQGEAAAAAAADDSPQESSAEDEDEADEESQSGGGELKRAKRQVYYQSGYDGKENCDGLPLEVNIRSRVKLDQIFPIFGKSQMRKCVKPKRPFHILPPPPGEHY